MRACWALSAAGLISIRLTVKGPVGVEADRRLVVHPRVVHLHHLLLEHDLVAVDPGFGVGRGLRPPGRGRRDGGERYGRGAGHARADWRQLQRRNRLRRTGEGLQVLWRKSRRVGVGDILGDELLPLVEITHPAREHGQKRDIVSHGKRKMKEQG